MRGAFAAACWVLFVQAQQPPRDARPVPVTAAFASIAGVVTTDDLQPKPLRRAIVTLTGGVTSGGRTAITDDSGGFQFTGLAAGQYGVAAMKEGFVTRAFGSSRNIPRGRGAPPAPTTLALSGGNTRTIALRLPRGAVIAGTVTDPDGQPVPGIVVAAVTDRFERATGARRLGPAEAVTTDDRGVYRIFGLPAGQYVVYAQVSLPSDAREIRRAVSDARPLVAANIYYPSTPDGDHAMRIALGAGEERPGIDIEVQYVPTATVTGYVSGPQGASRTEVMLTRQNDAMSASMSFGISPTAPDGQFMFTRVAPGRYTVRTQGTFSSSGAGGSEDRQWLWGSTEFVVDGDDVTNVGIQLTPTFTISGRLAFEGATPAPSLSAMRLPVSIAASLPRGVPQPSLQILDGGRFAIGGLVPGMYRPLAAGAPLPGIQAPIGPWWLRSFVVDGHELLDTPLDLRQGSDNGIVTFADQASAVSGSVKDAAGAPVAAGYVITFSTDRAQWFVNSRRIVAVRIDAQGRYAVRNLPPGEYRAAIALDLEQGEWFDPDVLQRLLTNAAPVTISGTEAKTLDLVLR